MSLARWNNPSSVCGLTFTRWRRCIVNAHALAYNVAGAVQGEAGVTGVLNDVAVAWPVCRGPGVLAIVDLTGQAANYS